MLFISRLKNFRQSIIIQKLGPHRKAGFTSPVYLDYTKETLLCESGGFSSAKYFKSRSWAYCASEEGLLFHLPLPENVPFPGRLDSGRSRGYGARILPFDMMDVEQVYTHAVQMINWTALCCYVVLLLRVYFSF